MEIFEGESGALCAPCVEEIERSLALGRGWALLTRLFNRRFGTSLRAQTLRRCYSRSRGAADRDCVAAALADAEEETP